MDCPLYLRRFVALSLCLVLAFVSSCPVVSASDPVTAASLTVVGGQLATGGLTGEALASVAGGPVGAIVGIALAALGVNAYVSAAAQQAGQTRTRFVLDKLMLYCTAAKIKKDDFFRSILDGCTIAADGAIQLSEDTCLTLRQFVNWLFTEDYVQTSISSGVTDVMVGDYKGLPVTYSQYYSGNITDAGAIACSLSAYPTVDRFVITNKVDNYSDPGYIFCVQDPSYGYYYIYFLSRVYVGGYWWFRAYFYDSAGNINSTLTTCSLSAYSGTPNSQGYYLFEGRFSNTAVSITGLPDYSASNSVVNNVLYNQTLEFIDHPASDEVFTGSSENWATDQDLLSPAIDGESVTLNPDLLNSILSELEQGTVYTMGIDQYLAALETAFDQSIADVKTGLATITDQLTGIQEEVAIPAAAVENPSITDTTTDNNAIIPSDSNIDVTGTATGFSYDLTQIFPFCIPFDIYALLSVLNAEPVAPSYHVYYEAPYNIVIDFTVDLSPWNSVAAVLRTLELLAFCIGLAYVTRSMFIRS